MGKKYEMAGPDDCWPWRGALRFDGGGMVGLPQKEFGYRPNAKNKCHPRVAYVHRVVMMLILGRELDPSEWVQHTCGTRSCGNPGHLILRTKEAK